MKIEPFSEEEQDVLLDIKLEKNEHETFTTMNATGKTSHLEERSLHNNLMFDMIKEETEDICDGDVEKTQNTFVQEKTEQLGDLLENDIISKFSDSNDDSLDSSSYNGMNVKMKTEFQEEIEPVCENTSDMKTGCVSQCPIYHVAKQENFFTEVVNFSKPNSGICGETTLNGNNLNKLNIPQYKSKTYSCVTSRKEFRTLENLTHKERIESGEKSYHCAIFRKHFQCNRPLDSYERNHTGKKLYSCGICRKDFVSRYTLKSHQRTHACEKPYSYAVYSKHFDTNSTLKQHQIIHTGEKSYNCEICEKQFGRNSELKRHQETHTGEKPYRCTILKKNNMDQTLP
ncbi:uncharacterized protein LOC143235298 [Tachypleus tridentatus]|uniref:uncharacterized protein LOC143235298 n=1 Tax=Tachypleus tridentatus TaxID=6853 RepID=UPI003FD1F451